MAAEWTQTTSSIARLPSTSQGQPLAHRRLPVRPTVTAARATGESVRKRALVRMKACTGSKELAPARNDELVPYRAVLLRRHHGGMPVVCCFSTEDLLIAPIALL